MYTYSTHTAFESHSVESKKSQWCWDCQGPSKKEARGEGERFERLGMPFCVCRLGMGVGSWFQGHKDKVGLLSSSLFLAIASLARKSNLSSLIRGEESEQWAPTSKMTAQFNGVEELGREACFVCLELVPLNMNPFWTQTTKQLKLDSYFTRNLQVPAPFNTGTSRKSRWEPGSVSKVRL